MHCALRHIQPRGGANNLHRQVLSLKNPAPAPSPKKENKKNREKERVRSTRQKRGMASHAQLSNNFHPRIVELNDTVPCSLLSSKRVFLSCLCTSAPRWITHARATRRTAHHDKQAPLLKRGGRKEGRQNGGRYGGRAYAGVTLMLKISRWPK